jgi:hypothetical protein
VKYLSLQKPALVSPLQAFRVKLEAGLLSTRQVIQAKTDLLDSRDALVKVSLSWQVRALGFALFAGVIAFLILGLLTAASSIGSRNQSNSELARLNDLSRVALQAKSLAAELNGWQTSYAFEVSRGSKQALLDSSPTRTAFLNSSRLLSQQLSSLELRTQSLSTLEQQQLITARKRYQEFVTLDQRIIEMYRTGNAKLVQRASDLVLNQEIDLFKVFNDSITALAENITIRAENQASTSTYRSSLIHTPVVVFWCGTGRYFDVFVDRLEFLAAT